MSPLLRAHKVPSYGNPQRHAQTLLSGDDFLSNTTWYTTLHYTTLHYTTLHYTTYTTLHYTTLHYTTLHYTTLHHTTLHYTTLLRTWYRLVLYFNTVVQKEKKKLPGTWYFNNTARTRIHPEGWSACLHPWNDCRSEHRTYVPRVHQVETIYVQCTPVPRWHAVQYVTLARIELSRSQCTVDDHHYGDDDLDYYLASLSITVYITITTYSRSWSTVNNLLSILPSWNVAWEPYHTEPTRRPWHRPVHAQEPCRTTTSYRLVSKRDLDVAGHSNLSISLLLYYCNPPRLVYYCERPSKAIGLNCPPTFILV